MCFNHQDSEHEDEDEDKERHHKKIHHLRKRKKRESRNIESDESDTEDETDDGNTHFDERDPAFDKSANLDENEVDDMKEETVDVIGDEHEGKEETVDVTEDEHGAWDETVDVMLWVFQLSFFIIGGSDGGVKSPN